MADLKPEQFDVLIDGKKRPVASLSFLRASTADGAVQPASKTTPTGSAAASPDGRIFILGIDQTSFPVAGEPAAREAARRLIERLAPEDFLGLVAFPGPISIAPTRDRQKVRDALTRITGLWTDTESKHSVSAAEATAFQTISLDPSVVSSVLLRECCPSLLCTAKKGGNGGKAIAGSADYGFEPVCSNEVTQQARELCRNLEMRAAQSVGGLEALIDGVAGVPGRKTIVLVSAGIPTSNRPGARPDVNSAIASVARRAEAANANLYVLYMNVHFLGQFAASRANFSIFDDVALFGRGLGQFAGGAGGEFYQIEVSSAKIIERLVKATSAYYLIGIAPIDSERDGKEHFITVRVNKATVLSRRTVTIPKKS
jgi:VWFA-related protein